MDHLQGVVDRPGGDCLCGAGGQGWTWATWRPANFALFRLRKTKAQPLMGSSSRCSPQKAARPSMPRRRMIAQKVADDREVTTATG